MLHAEITQTLLLILSPVDVLLRMGDDVDILG